MVDSVRPPGDAIAVHSAFIYSTTITDGKIVRAEKNGEIGVGVESR